MLSAHIPRVLFFREYPAKIACGIFGSAVSLKNLNIFGGKLGVLSRVGPRAVFKFTVPA